MHRGRESTIEECGEICGCGHQANDHDRRVGASRLGPYSTWFYFKCLKDCRCMALHPNPTLADD